MVYDPVQEGKRLIFGVSGALYRSAAVLYDRQSESLWAQPLRQAVAGPLTGATLGIIPSERMRWKAWSERHPDTLVLSTDTGYARDYGADLYAEYRSRADPSFPVKRMKSACKFPAKAHVLGVEAGGAYRAYLLSELKKARRVRDVVGGKTLEIAYDDESRSARARFEDGELAPATVVYWFAWQAFHPETDCLRIEKK